MSVNKPRDVRNTKLLSTVILEFEDGKNLIMKLKSINLKDVAYWVTSSWANVGVQKREVLPQVVE